MTALIDSLSAKLVKALTKIGRTNGLAAPNSQDEMNTLLHNLYVDETAEKFFKKQKESSLKAVQAYDEKIEDRVTKAVADTKKQDSAQDVVLADSPDYTLTLTTRKGAASFKKEKAIVYLRKIGWSQDQVDGFVSACTDSNEPAKSFRVALKTEQE
jgi:hypothetical protein